MYGVESLSGNERAVALVGIVLVEAAVLYVGYGAVERVVGPTVAAALRGE